MSIQSMGSSTRKWPLGASSKLGRITNPVRWAAPSNVNRVRVMGNGRKILPNRGDMLPIRGR